MKTIAIGLALATTFIACSNSNNQSKEAAKNDSTSSSSNSTATNNTSNNTASFSGAVNDVVSAYLKIKNSLAEDNAQDAATGGNDFVAAIGKLDKSALTDEQKKVYDDAASDAKEMAEHIGKSADKIDHQREHFDMLSQDVYDMVKTFGTTQTLYKDFCPMYNNKKGASWLSETKDIKNPYMGKKMQTCGEVKEEIKK